jgi:hypothetical protein
MKYADFVLNGDKTSVLTISRLPIICTRMWLSGIFVRIVIGLPLRFSSFSLFDIVQRPVTPNRTWHRNFTILTSKIFNF